MRFATYWYPQITYHHCRVSNQDMKAFPRIKISFFNHLFSGVIFVSNRVIWSPTIPDITPSIPLIYGWYCWWRKSCTTWDARNLVNNGINYLSTGAGFLPSTVCHTVESYRWYICLSFPVTFFHGQGSDKLVNPLVFTATSGCPRWMGKSMGLLRKGYEHLEKNWM